MHPAELSVVSALRDGPWRVADLVAALDGDDLSADPGTDLPADGRDPDAVAVVSTLERGGLVARDGDLVAHASPSTGHSQLNASLPPARTAR